VENAYSPAWFEIFARGDAEPTEREVAFLLRFLPQAPASVLDVPCGFGRHARALTELGYRVTGVEIEAWVAAETRGSGIEVHELDMRRLRDLPETFDAVICMWASFGFFDDATNEDVLAQMAEKTRADGLLVLDVYDPVWFRARQGPRLLERDGRHVQEHKWVAGDRLHVTLDYEDRTRDEFEWRLYTPDELRELGERVGLACRAACADFDVAASPHGEAARMQLVFRRC
jgi:SAM-dependent methyltransferase